MQPWPTPQRAHLHGVSADEVSFLQGSSRVADAHVGNLPAEGGMSMCASWEEILLWRANGVCDRQ
eukprot:363237-Chlamydomonas_euryale.AAC.5